MATVVTRRDSSGAGRIVGLALGPATLCAVLQDREGGAPRVWRTDLTPPPVDENGEWASLSAAFVSLMHEVGATAAEASLALLPPLAEVRAVTLPPLSEADTHQLLLRNAGKYFVSARGAQVVASSPLSTRSDDAAPRIAVAAPVRLLRAVQESAQSAGLSIRAFVPAEAAWAAAGAATGPTASAPQATKAAGSGNQRHRTSLLVLYARQAHLLTVDHNALLSVRRFRAVDVEAPRLAEAVAELGAPLWVAGSASNGKDGSAGFLAALHGALQSAAKNAVLGGGATAPSATLLTGHATHADALAAAGAGLVRSPVLETESTRQARGLHTRRLATRLFAAAAACVLLAGALQL